MLESAASRNDGTISYGNESAVSQREREKEGCERSTKGPAVIECHSHGPMLLATVLTRSLIASWDKSFCTESQREAAGTPDVCSASAHQSLGFLRHPQSSGLPTQNRKRCIAIEMKPWITDRYIRRRSSPFCLAGKQYKLCSLWLPVLGG